ncbi:MAG: GAP family protein [Silvibacterium sp.]
MYKRLSPEYTAPKNRYGRLWSKLIPLIIFSAIPPVQIVVTLLLARSSIRAAVAWVAGITSVRLIQGILFGFVFSAGNAESEATAPGFIAGLMLVLAVVFYVTALRKALADEDEDAPPPQWMAKAESMSPLAAFGAGAGFMTIIVKFWVFTLGAISAIAGTHLGAKLSILTFSVFVVLAQSGHFAILALAASSSSGSPAAVETLFAWLQRNNRIITIVLGVTFGTWFLFKALVGLGLT